VRRGLVEDDRLADAALDAGVGPVVADEAVAVARKALLPGSPGVGLEEVFAVGLEEFHDDVAGCEWAGGNEDRRRNDAYST